MWRVDLQQFQQNDRYHRYPFTESTVVQALTYNISNTSINLQWKTPKGFGNVEKYEVELQVNYFLHYIIPYTGNCCNSIILHDPLVFIQ